MEADLDLFVSYATKDSLDIARNVVIDLERRGLRCWIAPRNIPAGTVSWASEIMKGIRGARGFLLLLSEGANASEEIEKELNDAARQRKPLFVIRLQDIEPADGLGYHLNKVQWRDLFRNREDVLNEIANRALLLRQAPAAKAASVADPRVMSPPPIPAPGPAAQHAGRRSALIIGATVVGGLVSAALGWAFMTAPPRPGEIREAKIAVDQPGKDNADLAEKQRLEAASIERVRRLSDILLRAAPQAPNVATVVSTYEAKPRNKALAVSPPRNIVSHNTLTTVVNTSDRVLELCEATYGSACILIAVNDEVLPAPQGDAWQKRPMPRVAYSGLFDPDQIPAAHDALLMRPDVNGYRRADGPKAAAYNAWARQIFIVSGAATQNAAETQALEACRTDMDKNRSGGLCLLYAAGDQVVFAQRATQPVSRATVTPATAAPANLPPLSTAAPTDQSTPLKAILSKLAPGATNVANIDERYRSSRSEKALVALAPDKVYSYGGWAVADDVQTNILESCELRHGSPCALIARNDEILPEPGDGKWPRASLPRLTYAGVFDPQQIPAVNGATRTRADVTGYREAKAPKAVAFNPIGRLFVVTNGTHQQGAEQKALDDCNANIRQFNLGGSCLLYASDTMVVLPSRSSEPVSRNKEAVRVSP